MCPEPGILSAFFDGELPDILKERIGRHVSECSACTARIERYEILRRNLTGAAEPDLYNAMYRVKTRVENTGYFMPSPSRYGRGITVPIPLAAAWLLAFLVLGALVLVPGISRKPTTFAELPPEVTEQLAVTIKVDSMDQLLELLSSQSRFKEVTIELPEVPQFSPVGEPRFLREADYRQERSK